MAQVRGVKPKGAGGDIMNYRKLCATASVFFVSGLAFGSNLLVNPGFENGDSGWGQYDKSVWRLAPGEGEGGSTAMLYELEEGHASRLPRQKVRLVPGKNYRYSVRVRHENLHLDDKRDNGVQICLVGYDSAGKQTCGRYSHGMRGTSDGWYEMWELLYDVPSNTVDAAFQISVWNGLKGKAWFDNAKVEEFVPPPVESLHSSAYRDCAWSGKVVFAAALTVPPEMLRGAKAKFSFVSGDGRRTSVAADSLDAFTAKVELEVASLAMGKQTLGFVLTDASGKELGRAELPFERLPERPKDWHAWIDENRVMRIQGERFFPIGIYYGAKKLEEGLRIFSDADVPINTFHCYGVPTLAGLDACLSKGVRVIPGINNVYAGSRTGMKKGIFTIESQRKYVNERVNPIKNHPAIIGWYLNDEPRPILAEKMADQQRYFAQIDPTRPTCSTFDHPEYVRGFMKGFDILDIDPYPVGRWPIRTVLDWSDMMRSGALSVKPLWLTPQAFSWKWFRMGRSMPDARMPTREELGSMVWQGVVAGATGVNFYGPGHFLNEKNASTAKENFAILSHVVKELRRVAPAIVSPETPVRIEGVPSPLRTRAWRLGRDSYVLVVNPEPMSVKAKLKLSESFVKSNVEAGSGLRLVGGNVLEVDFAPIGYGVLRLCR